MAAETYVLAYEGHHGDAVLDYAIEKARKDGAKLLLVHILEWSPYSFLTNEELAERHKRRNEEVERAHKALLEPAIAKARAAGLEVESELRYGSVVDLVVKVAEEAKAALIIVGRAGKGGLGARVFGSVAIGLAQCAPVPTIIVP